MALAAQGFCDPRPTGRVDKRHLRRVMGRLKLLQLDSVPVIIRTQYMPLFARLGPYRTALLDEIAYGADEWFEAWTHEASLVPVETEPLLRWAKDEAAAGGTWGHLAKFAAQEPAYVDSVLAQVDERGPLAASDLDDPRPQSGEWWGSRSHGALALDWLFRIGAVGVRRTPGFEKRFDLLDRIVPAEIRALPTPTVADAQRELVRQSAEALGIATAGDVADYFRLKARDVRPLLDDLVESGELVHAEVDGWSKPAFVHADAARRKRPSRNTLLTPFDPMVWHRDRAVRLFDFEYRIEIYVPAAKRKYGYYVMPFLMGDRIAARLDLKTDRADGVLRVLGAFAESWADPREVAESLTIALGDLAQLVGVDEVVLGTRGDLMPHLVATA